MDSSSMTILDWMEQSGLGIWVAQSPAGYYIMLAFHSLGLATLVGTSYVVNFRVLGLTKLVPYTALDRFYKIGIYGFYINLLSGIAIFISEANKAFYSNSFRWKMLLMVLAMICTVTLHRTVLQRTETLKGGEAPAAAKTLAAASFLFWTATIIVGRMMAYLTDPSVG